MIQNVQSEEDTKNNHKLCNTNKQGNIDPNTADLIRGTHVLIYLITTKSNFLRGKFFVAIQFQETGIYFDDPGYEALGREPDTLLF